jgi:hypothetical protein
MGLAIGANEGTGLGGSDQLFGTPRLHHDDKIPTTVTSEDMAMLQEILLANGSHAHASRSLDDPPRLLPPPRSAKRQRTDDNSGAVVDLTSPRSQTEPPIRSMPQGVTPVAPTPSVPVKVEEPKGDNSLLFIGLAALAGFFILR